VRLKRKRERTRFLSLKTAQKNIFPRLKNGRLSSFTFKLGSTVKFWIIRSFVLISPFHSFLKNSRATTFTKIK